ncbi:hypothetical protein [Escherichia coli]|nr:hypothetical protein [Escherichia coli]
MVTFLHYGGLCGGGEIRAGGIPVTPTLHSSPPVIGVIGGE